MKPSGTLLRQGVTTSSTALPEMRVAEVGGVEVNGRWDGPGVGVQRQLMAR
jgi:hypothetical protein